MTAPSYFQQDRSTLSAQKTTPEVRSVIATGAADQPSTPLDAFPGWFAMPQEAEGPLELTNSSAGSLSALHEEFPYFHKAFRETGTPALVRSALTRGQRIEPGLSLPKRIFPFHSFL
jgi:hypothetical protein